MTASTLTESLRETLAVFDGSNLGTPLTTKEVSAHLDLGRRSTYSRLERLAERDLVETKKVGARGRVWWRSPAGADGVPGTARSDVAERELRRELDLLDRVVEISPIGIGVFDAGGDSIRSNQRFADLLGADGDDSWEYSLGDPTPLDGDGEVIPYPERPGPLALTSGEAITDQRLQVVGSDGERRWLSVSAEPLGGEVEGVVVTMADVTALERQSRQLARQRDEVRTELEHVFDRVDDAFWALDAEFRITYINDRASELLGRSEAELLGQTVSEAFPWLSDTDAPEKFEEAMASGRTVRFEDYLAATGRWYDVRVYPSESGLSVYYQDVTERKRHERQLEESRNRYRTLVENFPNGAVTLVDRDLRYTTVGGTPIDTADATVADLEGSRLREHLSPELADLLVPRYAAALDGERSEFETELGGRVYQFQILPVRNDDGEVFAAIGMSQDVTERRRRERDLERYETIVETVDDGIYALDENGEFVLVNDAYCEIVGFDREELLGRDATVVHDEEIGRRAGRLAGEVAAGERDMATIELDIVVEAGHSIPVETRLAPYPIGDGFGRCGVVRDVTERVERERELERYVRIVDAVGEPVYELDAHGNVTFVNDAMVEYTGYREAELLGEHPSIMMEEEAVARAESHIVGLLTDDQAVRSTLEYDIVTKDGQRVPVENRLSVRTDGDGQFLGSAGLIWDVTERKARERELEESERRYRTLVENFPNGIVTLFDEDLRYQIAGGELFDVFGSAPEEMVGETIYERNSPEDVEVLEPAYEAALDGETRSMETEYAGRTIQIWTEPVTDEAGEVFAGMAMSQDITDRVERERELERQRERLVALNDLNGVVREITDAVIEQSTRGQIEVIVCERLAETDSYAFAWIGEVDGPSGRVTPRAEAGVEGFLDDVTITVDPDDEGIHGPTARALRELEIQVTQNVGTGSSQDPWRGQVGEYGFRSSAAIPIVHGGTLFGVLNVYADRPQAFSEDEQAVIGQLGEVVGHAIAAVERKQALMSDQVVEIEFRIQDVLGEVGVPAPAEGSISFEQTIPIGDGTFLVYGTATGDAADTLDAMVGSSALPHWESVHFLASSPEEARFELRMDEPPLISTAASHGGYVHEASIEDGDYRMRVHLAPSADVRQVVEAVREVYPELVHVTRQQTTRSRRAMAVPEGTAIQRLTDRQRTAIETAFYAGYFGWPRDSNGEDVAASLGIDPSTFHRHLREAQRKILDWVLGGRA